MIVGIGCDIVDHDLVNRLNWINDENLLNRFFSKEEIEIFHQKNSEKKIRFISGRYAVKEAVLKCIGTGMQDGIALSNIKVMQSKDERPVLVLVGLIKTICDDLKINSWHISISHSLNYSIAYAVAESK